MKRQLQIKVSYEPHEETRALEVLSLLLKALKDTFSETQVTVHVDASEPKRS